MRSILLATRAAHAAALVALLALDARPAIAGTGTPAADAAPTADASAGYTSPVSVAGVAVAPAAPAAPSRPPACACEFPFRVAKQMPDAPGYGGDALFWAVVEQGRSAIPRLLSCAKDATPTPAGVRLVGGVYTVGDIALRAVQEIVHGMPVRSWCDDPAHPSVTTNGEDAYWAYVRTDPAHRALLASRAAEWLMEHASELEWHPDRRHPAHGWWELPGASAPPASVAIAGTSGAER